MELAPHVDPRLVRFRRPVDARLAREVPHDRTALADRQLAVVQQRQLAEGGARLPVALEVVEDAVVRQPARLEDQPRQLTWLGLGLGLGSGLGLGLSLSLGLGLGLGLAHPGRAARSTRA